jgi:hypothetical protein
VPEDPGVRVTLLGVSEQVRPADGEVEELRFTVPGNALTEETVIVEVTAEPELVITLVGLAMIVKSGTLMLKVTVVVWERVPLVPLTVTVYDPANDGWQDRLEEPEPPMIVVGLRLQLMLVVGDVVKVRVTVPANPLDGLTVIVEVSVEPTFPVWLVGFEEIVKSSITNVALVEWESVPLAPVMVRMYDPAIVELQETDAELLVDTMPGEMGTQFRPEGIESVSVTVPVKPFR